MTEYMESGDYISVYAAIAAAAPSFMSGFTTVIISGVDGTYSDVVKVFDDGLKKLFITNAAGDEPTITWDASVCRIQIGAGRLVDATLF
ncbi:MAG: hypothetical protein HC892_00165 [Saprospiraceae bacterium]|nr:hypothetical protein [Saprospiraceae bacterium]